MNNSYKKLFKLLLNLCMGTLGSMDYRFLVYIVELPYRTICVREKGRCYVLHKVLGSMGAGRERE